ncbi:1,6-anhydro-N-acetylmuramyl-L-alanine amidase AmpD [Thiohalophilus sp.]|uniref:1,6-anhydro-N-acetylmuramyl-L-alanine amidase AmpD n=1 Tax=Thiohalophilus sp. TaxID=3028392 RepID=UPI002ACE26F5|nr:1,6-anhydro-N-acetylmuramyl-L-alanine amidase AmpD [Thiohalophilus sp.]MDZ7803040.1 1,6-anhydro-N-acetylmuramyl-L-alanine amidase AmpD [Thiohalophilus sp.]
MQIDPHTGLLQGARQCPSPNYNARPDPGDISLLVIHGISLPPQQFGGDAIDRFFTNCLDPAQHPYFREICDLQVSAHLLIRRNGELVQYVPFGERAWHAGDSQFAGRTNCNDFSIGIELEGSDELPYEPVQYQQLQAVTRLVQQAYPAITRERIVGHCDIAPGRKTDPGPAFDWARLMAAL